MSLEQNKKYIDEFIVELRKKIVSQYKKSNYEEVLRLSSSLATILYETNQAYVDVELENILSSVADKVLSKNDVIDTQDIILFYDGFGLNSRGLIQVYMKALCRIKKIVYVTIESQKEAIPDVLKLLNDNDASVEFIQDHKEFSYRINELEAIVRKYAPKEMFMYTKPNDVVAYVIFKKYEGVIRRYQVNLTDHAFWIGSNVFDYCIEFRNYGATISNQYRNVPLNRIVVLPFYPSVNEGVAFKGYPEGIDEKDIFFFSGGALYKTLGAGNKFYAMVDALLDDYENIIFWYAGSGNQLEMNKLIKKYPGRVVLTEERSDFFEIIKRSCFYLSTYPICGGLMFQYAAKAGRVPLTLKHDNITDDFLLNQEGLNIEYTEIEPLIEEADRLIHDNKYREQRENEMKSAVIDEEVFYRELKNLIECGKTNFEVRIKNMDIDVFRKEYLGRMSKKEINMILAQKEHRYLIKYFPIKVLKGITSKLIYKFCKIM